MSTKEDEPPGSGPGDPSIKVEHVVLGVVNWWSTKFSHKQVQAMVERNFDQEEILDAQKVLAKALGETVEPKKRQNSQLRPAVEAQAEDICDKVDTLIKENRMPKVLIPCDQLGRVPLSTLNISDEQSVCARLESLEQRMTKMCESVEKFQEVAKTTSLPQVVVTTAGTRQVPTVSQPQTYAQAAGGQSAGVTAKVGGAPSLLHPQGYDQVGQFAGISAQLSRQIRERSPSVKRKNPEDDVKERGTKETTRKPRKVGNGASKIALEDIESEGLAGPVDYYIGNTDKRADGDIIARVLRKCAAQLDGGADLEVLEVELLTSEENPRTKCWKVTVPFKFKNLMENDEMYLPGWKHRKFFGTRKKWTDNTKKSRLEAKDQVEAMLRERELEAEQLKIRHEKELEDVASAPVPQTA